MYVCKPCMQCYTCIQCYCSTLTRRDTLNCAVDHHICQLEHYICHCQAYLLAKSRRQRVDRTLRVSLRDSVVKSPGRHSNR